MQCTKYIHVRTKNLNPQSPEQIIEIVDRLIKTTINIKVMKWQQYYKSAGILAILICQTRIIFSGLSSRLLAQSSSMKISLEFPPTNERGTPKTTIGEDLLNASSDRDNNRLDGGAGNEELLGSRDSQIVRGSGDDILNIVSGGNNFLYGNSGTEQTIEDVGSPAGVFEMLEQIQAIYRTEEPEYARFMTGQIMVDVGMYRLQLLFLPVFAIESWFSNQLVRNAGIICNS